MEFVDFNAQTDPSRSHQAISNESLVATIGVDAAEIELLEVHLVFKLRDQIFTDPSRPAARFGRFAPCRTRIRQARTLSVAPRSEELASDACIAGVTSRRGGMSCFHECADVALRPDGPSLPRDLLAGIYGPVVDTMFH